MRFLPSVPLLPFVLFLILLTPTVAGGAWVADGTVVCSVSGEQSAPVAVADGSGENLFMVRKGIVHTPLDVALHGQEPADSNLFANLIQRIGSRLEQPDFGPQRDGHFSLYRVYVHAIVWVISNACHISLLKG